MPFLGIHPLFAGKTPATPSLVNSARDLDELTKLGVAGVFPAGSEPDDMINTIRDLAAARVRERTEAALTN